MDIKKINEGVESKKSVSDEDKPKKFLNGWTNEQERLMADWSDIASCYRWLHDQSEKVYHMKNLCVNIPVIILSTLGGTANFAAQALFEGDETSMKYASFAIGGISIFAGMLTTIGNYLRYAQLEESHRVASITWGKFQRLLAVELALNPNDRIDSLDFLKICRAELDRLIEQSPPLSTDIIHKFEHKFGSIKDLKKPDVCGALGHTIVFESSETRLKNMATEAALMLRRKHQTLNELVSPQIEKKIGEQIEVRIHEAIKERKMKLEEEIELQRIDALRTKEEFEKTMEERKKKIQDEIDLVKKKNIHDVHITKSGSNFESKLNYKKIGTSVIQADLSKKEKQSEQIEDSKISIDVPQSSTSSSNIIENENVIIINKE